MGVNPYGKVAGVVGIQPHQSSENTLINYRKLHCARNRQLKVTYAFPLLYIILVTHTIHPLPRYHLPWLPSTSMHPSQHIPGIDCHYIRAALMEVVVIAQI